MKYLVSRFLVRLNKETNLIQNIRTGERTEITDEVLNLLSFFKEEKTLEEVLSFIDSSEEEKKEIEFFLQQLIDDNILVPYPESEELFVDIMNLTEKALVQRTNNTFFNVPSGDLYLIGDKEVVFVGIPFDLGTTGFPGARFGPDRIRKISANQFEYQADLFTGKSKGWFSFESNKIVLRDIDMIDIGNIIVQLGEGFDSFYNRVTEIVGKILEKESFPIIVGGDHSSSYACIRAFRKQYSNLSVIQIDAHTDLGDIIPGIPNNHGNVFTRVMKENLVDHIYQFGFRGMTGKRVDLQNYSLFPLCDLINSDSTRFLDFLDVDRNYYVSLDIDVIDPAFAPGTGVPMNGGMEPKLLYEILSQITERFKVVGFDIVEVNPMLDINDQTSRMALEIIFHFLSKIFS
mgnify:CR=1 FL=1